MIFPRLLWLGLFVSLNQTAPITRPLAQPGLAAEATAVVGVGRLTVTTIYIQPVQKRDTPLLSIGVGMRVF